MNAKIKKIGLLNYIDDLTGNKLSYLHYCIHKFLNKPYFGSYLASSQGQKIRHQFMQAIIEEKFKDHEEEIYLLEIGSWAGGSVLTWISVFEKMNKKYKIFCIDPWEDYLSEEQLWTHKTMKNAVRENKIYNLFLHNIQASGHNENVSILRGTTSEMSKILKNDSFDIVFIDGNHSYDFVKLDIEITSALVKNKGILCGDDLELQYQEVNKEQLEMNKHKDVVCDSILNKNYHPGVTLAVKFFFNKPIQSLEGFWFVEKNINHWAEINIDNINFDDLKIPKHLTRAIL